MNFQSSLIQKTFIVLLAVVGSLLYYPGLYGGFMLDDLSSLPPLFDSINGCGFWCGVMSGSTGPTGRPLSLITFAWQANSWPEAFPFKLVNLLIHLINSVLIVLIFRKVLKLITPSENFFYIPILAGFLWAVWPLQVSTVLYVVQRMVLLSSTFVLLGVLYYLTLRAKLFNEWAGNLRPWILLAAGLAFFGIAAIYTKESGVLLLFYIFVLEFLLFKTANSAQPKDRLVSFFRFICLIVPACAFIAYILMNNLGRAEELYILRSFSLEERFLTQGRVLVDYLNLLLVPRVSELGLYHDDYVFSRSFLDPLSTLFCWLFLVFLMIIAWYSRVRFRLLSLAICWFFAGHILESTILPLELYFEHRNYLPIAFISLALVTYSYSLVKLASQQTVKIVFYSIIALYLAIILLVTFNQTRLWGNELQYKAVQASEHSGSVRARSLLVDAYNQLGEIDKAFVEMQKMQKDFPDIAGMIVGHIEFACYDPKYPILPIEELVTRLEQARFGFGAIVTIQGTLEEISEGKCTSVTTDYVLRLIHALQRNPLYVTKRNLLKGFEASAYFQLGELQKAVDILKSFPLSAEQWPFYISLLATLGHFEEAIQEADKGIDALKYKPQYSYYIEDLKRLKQVILLELEHQAVMVK